MEWGPFFCAPVPSGCTSTMVLSIDTASSLMSTHLDDDPCAFFF